MSVQSDHILQSPTDQPQIPNVPEDQNSNPNQSKHDDSVFELQLLEEFLGAVDEEDVLTEFEGAMIDKPTFYSPHSFHDN